MKLTRWLSMMTALAAMAFSVKAAAWEDLVRGKVLVLGDSVAFGYIANAGYEYVNPHNFRGFADDLADKLNLDAVDAACPGETTGSFLSAAAPDNGCREFRSVFPLHVDYSASQADYATDYLKRHHDVRLVTVTLGANDALLLQAACDYEASCILAGLPTTAANLAKIIEVLRATGYAGPIVLTNYYSTDYASAITNELTAALNQTIAAPAKALGAAVADVFATFEKAVVPFGYQTCVAGLLNVSNPSAATPPYSCDIHPALSGHRLITESIVHVLPVQE